MPAYTTRKRVAKCGGCMPKYCPMLWSIRKISLTLGQKLQTYLVLCTLKKSMFQSCREYFVGPLINISIAYSKEYLTDCYFAVIIITSYRSINIFKDFYILFTFLTKSKWCTKVNSMIVQN